MQTRSDDALWLACRVTEGGCGETEGILVVYVDDLAFLGPEGLCRAFILAVQTSWKTSEPEWLNASPVTFCGMDLSRHPAGFRMCQAAYVQELLGRYGIEGSSMVPISKWVEPEVVDSPSPEDVRDAQAITGALLWLSTRDLAYVVSRCGQQATKNPNLSVSLGKQALAYLRSTMDFGIDVPFRVGSFFSDHGLLSLPRTERVIELYTDASHSPSGDRSMQAIFILWKGVPVAWEATRQAFTTLSSAEAELVAMMHGVQLSEAVQPLIEELVENDTVVSLLGDNEAALRSFQSTPSGWRNRHLAGRERIDANLLKVSHIPGEVQLADIGTKPLARTRLVQLLELMNIRGPGAGSDSAKTARMLSRLSLGSAHSTGLVAEALAGLAILAVLPRARGQPTEDWVEEGVGWLLWLVGAVLTGVSVLWGWWWLHGPGVFGLSTEAVLSEEGVFDEVAEGAGSGASVAALVGTVPSEDEDVFPSLGHEGLPEAQGTEVSGAEIGGLAQPNLEETSGDEFFGDEWEVARQRFERVERHTGLTFLQRAKLRKDLLAGGVIEPPPFL